MSYGKFTAQTEQRVATAINRDAKATTWTYKGPAWICADAARTTMAAGLQDGYEMDYCLGEQCQQMP